MTKTQRNQYKALAAHNAQNFLKLKDDLINLRISQGLTQNQIGQSLGLTTKDIADFEDDESDPRLTTLADYALAIGAQITIDIKLVI